MNSVVADFGTLLIFQLSLMIQRIIPKKEILAKSILSMFSEVMFHSLKVFDFIQLLFTGLGDCSSSLLKHSLSL